MTGKDRQKATQFKPPEAYQNPAPKYSPVVEVFFRLKLMPASLVQYSVEKVVLENNTIVSREVVTERDILPITLSKIEDLILGEVRR